MVEFPAQFKEMMLQRLYSDDIQEASRHNACFGRVLEVAKRVIQGDDPAATKRSAELLDKMMETLKTAQSGNQEAAQKAYADFEQAASPYLSDYDRKN